jgi:hypothetical protein
MYYGDQVCLRAIQSSDVDYVAQHFNKLELRRFLGVPIPKSRNYIEALLENRGSSDPWKDGLLQLSIIDKQSGTFLGLVNLKDIVKPHNRAELGISIMVLMQFALSCGLLSIFLVSIVSFLT